MIKGNSMGRKILRSMEKSRLSDGVAGQIEKAIQEGRFLPGDQLPAERALSEELGVSRPVLREALHKLEIQGLLEIQHGHGTFVKDRSAELLHAPLPTWLKANQHIIREFYEARLIIEPDCAALASHRATPEGLKELKRIIEQSEQVVQEDNIIAFIGLDIDFHSTIARMSGNTLLFQMLDSIINPETDLRKVIHRLPEHLPVAHARHIEILKAIESGKPETAHQAMVDALEGPLKDIEEY
ncbi:MAG: FadR family transcriptional regulator [Anaerolineales bacterium]|nr:FadR family transcriptional regulator [Anaerolineales bacterium]